MQYSICVTSLEIHNVEYKDGDEQQGIVATLVCKALVDDSSEVRISDEDFDEHPLKQIDFIIQFWILHW